MTIYETDLTIPGLFIEEFTAWHWFEEKFRLNHEILLNDGYLIHITSLVEYYLSAFRSYIDFEFFDSDHALYMILEDILLYIDEFIEYYKDSSVYVYIIGSI